MKKIIVVTVLLSTIIFSQENNSSSPFSNFIFGVYGGINFEEVSEVGGAFYIEGKTNLTSNLNLKFSVGYYKSIESINYTTRGSSGPIDIDTLTLFFAGENYFSHRVYDILPISFGLQYIFKNETVSPYILLEGNYNYIDTKRVRDGGIAWSYLTYEEIPDEFKNNVAETFPNESFGVGLGIGALYNLKKNIDLDFRYIFKYDSEIINTHQILIGINI